ncbi:SLC12A transporter, C-terminal,Amino acid permease/ SLC12A domain [Cinara cedri]|uniref:Solute carrier family 12 member 9 n=1 Tax=Cinara cedri TaxID=506608 RepID=A0A5E4M3R9_9HEMI|nr:SLC12A transporter, C-terminal,Amino acid permease/ SLC12A domain [Cinara cedri]
MSSGAPPMDGVSFSGNTGEKIPLMNCRRQVIDYFARVFGNSSTHSEDTNKDGYVEFGNIGEATSSRTLGMFAGVFAPVCLSMFSAMLFLRVGFVVGNAGLIETLIQFAIAYIIIVFTVMSVCAISTNGAVEGGGAYFMISRTLGPELGGSIGTLFFLANIVSSALCLTGCVEGLIDNFGVSGYLMPKGTYILEDGHWWRLMYTSSLNFLNLLICLIGASLFAKTTVIIFVIVVICLLSSFLSFFIQSSLQVPGNTPMNQTNETVLLNYTYTGFSLNTLTANLGPDFGIDYTSGNVAVTFSSAFGVLFCGVTGIMAGANMSGNLKNPSKSIPQGTLGGVLFTFISYISLSILVAATCSRDLLQKNYVFLMPINIWPPFISIGILTATFSASLSCLIGASRVLEALSKDCIYGSLLQFVNYGVWRSNPIAAVIFSWVLVQMILFIGSLNTIAQLNSILFLLAYVALNLTCLGLELTSAPNFRPSFKYFSSWTCSLGLIGSVIMMFVINPFYASTSFGLCLLLILLLHFFSPCKASEWGSISQALIFHQVRKYLLLLDSRKSHVKFWRPQMLLMIANPRSSCPSITFINDLKKSGLFVLGHVKVGEVEGNLDYTDKNISPWLTLVDHVKVKAFIELTVAKSVREGMHHLIRISGMGAMKPNTVVLGFYDDKMPLDYFNRLDSHYKTTLFQGISSNEEKFPLRPKNKKDLSPSEFVSMICDVFLMHKNVCICRHFDLYNKNDIIKNNKYKYIDVWPVNFFDPSMNDAYDTSSLFMLQLSCIIKMIAVYKKYKLRVHLLNTMDIQSQRVQLKQLLSSLRIKATIHEVQNWSQINNDSDKNVYISRVNQLIRDHCAETVICFVYLPIPKELHGSDLQNVSYLNTLTDLTNNLPPTILVHGVSPVTSTTL